MNFERLSNVDGSKIDLEEPTGGSSGSSQRSTGEVLLSELLTVLEPIVTASEQGPEEVALLLDESGIGSELFSEGSFEEVTAAFAASVETVKSTRAVLDGETPSPTEIEELLRDVVEVIQAIQELDGIPVNDPDIDAVGEKLLDFLIIDYLDREYPMIYAFFTLGGVIVPRDTKPDDLRLEKLPELLKDAENIPKDLLKWGTPDFDPAVLLYLLKAVFDQLGVPTSSKQMDPAELATLAQVQAGAAEVPNQLEIPVLTGQFGTAGLRLVPLPAGDSGNPGLGLVPFGTGSLNLGTTIDLDDDWSFEPELTGSASAGGWGLAVYPSQSGVSAQFRDLKQGSNIETNIEASAKLAYDGTTDKGQQTVLLGQPEATRVALGSLSLRARLAYESKKLGYEVGLPATGTLAVAPGDGDGFLQKILPEEGIAYDFDAEVGYASDQGLFFDRGGTLEVAIPQNVSLGPVTMKEIYLAALTPGGEASGGSGGDGTGTETTEGTITIAAAASTEITLGPVTATVKRMGVEADVSFPEDKDGNMGPVDMEIGFKPPSGAGVSIDAGPVSGGGYLEFDPENERYAGVLQLKTEKLTINAVGLLTTELPGGKDGFSLLLIISGEFPPVQLGMGFTLNGVGGLIGVNRSIKQKPLAKAVRSGSVGSIMFPEDPVANSQRIISDLRSIFPPTDGIHVVGPMAKLGYGGGSMITIDVGVILSIPTWKIVLLGKMSTALPSDEQAMIELNLAVRGLLDIPNKRVAIDASLYDSRIVAFTVSGDMALRSNWGDQPRFALSVGGWNPRFEPPSDFPDLDRLKASMGKKGDNFRVEMKGYLAVTSNTFQVGASVFAKAQAGPLQAKGTLAFDALFEFNPFKFVIDFLAKFSVTFKGKGLSVKLAGTFMGPGPFRIKGTVSIELLMLSVKKDINATIGPSKSTEELPRARVLPKLTEELGKPVNWRAQLPADGPEVATFREVEPGEEQVLAHPLGEIGVRQTVVPLDYEIEKFGKASPSGYTTFTIDTVRVNGSASVSLAAETEEDFAPAKYQKLSDSEKLNSDAFEKLSAGRKVDTEGVYCGDYEASPKNVRSAEFTYECTVIDRPRDNWATDLADLGGFAADDLLATSTLSAEVGESLVQVSPSAQSPARRAGENRFRLSEGDKRAFDAQAAGFASEIDVSRYGADAESDSAGSQQVVRGGGDPDVGGLSGAVSMDEQSYTIASAGDLREIDGVDGTMTKSEAQRELRKARESNPEAAKQLRVVEAREVQSGQAAATDGGQQ